MLLPVDCPFLTTATLNALYETFISENPTILIPTYKGKKGHPPVFHSSLKPNILALETFQGLNDFEHEQQAEIRTLALDDSGILATFNTLQEFETLKKKYKLT